VIGEAYFLSLERIYESALRSGKRKIGKIEKKLNDLVYKYAFYPMSLPISRWASWEVLEEATEFPVLLSKCKGIINDIEELGDKTGTDFLPSFYQKFKVVAFVLIIVLLIIAVILLFLVKLKVGCVNLISNEHFKFYSLIGGIFISLPMLAFFNFIILREIIKINNKIRLPMKEVERKLNYIMNRSKYFLELV